MQLSSLPSGLRVQPILTSSISQSQVCRFCPQIKTTTRVPLLNLQSTLKYANPTQSQPWRFVHYLTENLDNAFHKLSLPWPTRIIKHPYSVKGSVRRNSGNEVRPWAAVVAPCVKEWTQHLSVQGWAQENSVVQETSHTESLQALHLHHNSDRQRVLRNDRSQKKNTVHIRRPAKGM